MTTPIQTQLSTQFSPDSGAGIQLLIEPDPGAYADTDVHLLLFPAVGATLATSAGAVRLGNAKTVDVQPGIVQLSGGSSAQLPKRPRGESPTLQVLYAFDTEGHQRSISVSLDPTTGELRANAEVYAAVSYSAYKTEAFEVIYTPLVERLGEGVRTTFGVIAAFYPPRSQTVYQVPPFEIDEGDIKVEVYRIISYAVSNRDGEFEFPPNYPASGEYPGKSFTFDVTNSLQTERVHEIGYVNQRGHTWCTPFHVPIKEPYVGDPSYTPTKYFREAQLDKEKYPPDIIAKAKAFVAKHGLGPTGLPGA